MAEQPKYTSSYTGQQVEAAIARALPLDTFASATDETIGGVTYHILWKVAPTGSNTVYGFTIHPTTGELYSAKSASGTKTVAKVLNTTQLISDNDVDAVVAGTTPSSSTNYLATDGLTRLVKKLRNKSTDTLSGTHELVVHPVISPAQSIAPYKVKFDANGHIIDTAALQLSDLSGVPNTRTVAGIGLSSFHVMFIGFSPSCFT